MRLVTWNVESIRAHRDQVLAWVDRHRPDVLCLQETRATRRTFPRREFEDRGFELVIHGGDGGHGGVAIASRLALHDIVTGIPGAVAPLDEPRSISVTVGAPGATTIRLHTCYAPNGRKTRTRHHEIKLAWFALFTEWVALEREASDAVILVGDLNIAPTDLDVWDASRYRTRNLTSPPERAAFDQLVARCGLVDLVRDQHGDASVFTWWNRRGDFYEQDLGWRLDHALATRALADAVSTVAIDRAERGRTGAADHAPIIVDLELDHG